MRRLGQMSAGFAMLVPLVTQQERLMSHKRSCDADAVRVCLPLRSIVWLAGLVQTALYCDFFYHYYESKRGGMNRPVKLPV